MNLFEELERISGQGGKELLIKRYLLDCIEKYVLFRSSGILEKNLRVARLFLKGYATEQQIHHAEWELEGEAFGAEYYSDIESSFSFRCNNEIRSDLVKVRLKLRLSNKESRSYLTDMAYFIDGVFSYVECTANGIPGRQYERFMCQALFTKYFGGANG
ncbi:MAG: hypothetical protein P1U67_02550 [Alcanivoracaceae bacterium]|nr:hypothetical protein [Alcanivoracaceae bacterium]